MTTVTNTNPISITGGTMASGARATIYPNQIARSFKVVAVELVAGNTSSTVTISDGAGTHTLQQINATVAGSNIVEYPIPRTWGDWKVTTLTNTADTVYVHLK